MSVKVIHCLKGLVGSTNLVVNMDLSVFLVKCELMITTGPKQV